MDKMMVRERDRSRERVPPAPTSEEQDAMLRSRKKVREEGDKFSGHQSLVPRVEDWMTNEEEGKEASSQQKKSYKEACVDMPMQEDLSDEEDDWWSGDGWKSRIEVESTPRGPNIIVSPEFRQKLAKKWSTSLIVRLLGRMVREEQLGRKLQQLWGRRGEVTTIEIGSGYFLVRLTNEEDYAFALTGGPWLFMEHYLAVQPWKPEFDPDAGEVPKIAAWVRIPKFPVDFYDKGILYVVGSQVGKVLKVDNNTLKQTKGRFARICVEVDLNSPLLPSLMINGKEKQIVYEGLHLICFSCGRYGHGSEHCPHKKESGASGVQMSDNECEEQTVDPTQTNHNPVKTTYGEWMVAPRRRRVQRGPGGELNSSREGGRHLRSQHNAGGSRFAVLSDENREKKRNEIPLMVPYNSALDTTKQESSMTNTIKSRGHLISKKKQVEIKSGNAAIVVGRKIDLVSPMDHYQQVKNKMVDQGNSNSNKECGQVQNAGDLSQGIHKGGNVVAGSSKFQPIKGSLCTSSKSTGEKIQLPKSIQNSASDPIDPGARREIKFSTRISPLGEDGNVIMKESGEDEYGTMSQ